MNLLWQAAAPSAKNIGFGLLVWNIIPYKGFGRKEIVHASYVFVTVQPAMSLS